jgi:hypothetical protein
MTSSLYDYVISKNYRNDPRWKKGLIWAVTLLNSGVILCIIENMFYWVTLQRRSTAELEHYRQWDAIGPLFSGILAFLVQGLFAARSLAVSLAGDEWRAAANLLLLSAIPAGNTEITVSVLHRAGHGCGHHRVDNRRGPVVQV